MVKSRNDVKSAWFRHDMMIYVINQTFLKISTSNFVHIFISHCHISYVPLVDNSDFQGRFENYFF